MIAWILIAIAIIIILLAIVAVMIKKKYKRPTDYYSLFISGIIWIALGIIFDFGQQRYAGMWISQ